jgi:Bax protein
MQKHYQPFVVIAVLACIVGFYLVLNKPVSIPVIEPNSSSFTDIDLADFSNYSEVKEKKAAFFDFLLPLVADENLRIVILRQHLQSLAQHTDGYDPSQQQWLLDLAKKYRLNITVEKASPAESASLFDQSFFKRLLLRVDLIPPSLALAQAANESAWGTSRFAVEGNNLFGQWCFSKGCGLVPNHRLSGATHEVADFYSPRQSVESYIHNLNSNPSYTELRQLRGQQREKNLPLSGALLAQGLLKYSAREGDYVKELQSMIRLNQLEQYDSL